MSGVVREVEIEAPPEDVWDALVTEEGRERWLGEEAAGVEIESFEPHHRLVWQWQGEEGGISTVDFRIVAIPAGSRVIVTETEPALPLASLAASFALVAA
ncbi:MAG TPA: SRPBCC family protein [Solirubrobacteraceae bacterium]|nr:SRPBCC family protein [Solirubrobacteraceae bacterium]